MKINKYKKFIRTVKYYATNMGLWCFNDISVISLRLLQICNTSMDIKEEL